MGAICSIPLAPPQIDPNLLKQITEASVECAVQLSTSYEVRIYLIYLFVFFRFIKVVFVC